MSQQILDNTQISSAEDGQVASLPPQVSQPPPPQREMDTHTAHKNFIDPQLYFQNIFKADVLWSTSDPSGKLLVYWQLHPHDINPLLAYLTPLYHMWKGGMSVQMRVMGSAFHAGLLAGVALPPDVHPESLVENRGWTAYNWHAIDPKCQEMIEIDIPDINQGMFHYTDDKKGFENNWRGGYFACYVNSPLNTTTSGTPQIHVQFWCKPNRDFHFSYMRIPKPIETSAEIPCALSEALDFYGTTPGSPLQNFDIDKLKFLPSSVKTSTWSIFQSYTTEGRVLGVNVSGHNSRGFIFVPSEYNYVPLTGDGQFIIQPKKKYDFPFLPASYGLSSGVAYYWSTANVEPFAYYVGTHEGTPSLICSATVAQKQYVSGGHATLQFQYPLTAGRSTFVQGPTTFTQVSNESFAVFDIKYKSTSFHHQTNAISKLCADGRLKGWIPPGQCALFRIIDVDESLPIGYLKLFTEGYFTTTKVDAIVEFQINKLRCVFESFIGRTVPIPQNSEFSKNRFAIMNYHKSISDQIKDDLSDKLNPKSE